MKKQIILLVAALAMFPLQSKAQEFPAANAPVVSEEMRAELQADDPAIKILKAQIDAAIAAGDENALAGLVAAFIARDTKAAEAIVSYVAHKAPQAVVSVVKAVQVIAPKAAPVVSKAAIQILSSNPKNAATLAKVLATIAPAAGQDNSAQQTVTEEPVIYTSPSSSVTTFSAPLENPSQVSAN